MRMAGAETTSASHDHLNELAISIRSRFDGLSPPSDCCIFTVPESLRRTNEEAYTPHVIAIGPCHRLSSSLLPMEDHKLLYLQNFLQHNQNYRLEDYIQRVKSWEDDARNNYDKQIGLNSNQFAEMMLLDGIFVIQLFLMCIYHERRLPNDRIFGKPWLLNDVGHDMTLLENQMPFFVVQRLFKMAFGAHQQQMPELLEFVYQFFKPVTGMEKLPELAMELEVKHFLHVISLSFLPSERKEQNRNHKEMKFPPSATELVAAGVKLRKRESKCLLDIEFKNGVLNIPCLAVYDLTEYYFQNVIAFKQCYCKNRHLTNYMKFMDCLVDTPGDTELLINKISLKTGSAIRKLWRSYSTP
ncbi:hypothetical protein BT93_L0585 [Corymbia citriodora subsp. variegata]|uniref:Uncharacterized protein n=1 Tax=Corymbia citriodora subsp. variegata TaxID=360336 RepID=A0A8T0CWS5_CORYI|nr:hypothetical protein BT93_L0585 [Corymbia citriodora subsp. variegata]